MVLFDLDGTVIDSGGIILASMRHATREVLGRDIGDEELMGAVGGPGLEAQMRALDPERVDELVDASHRKLLDAPALVLACLTWDGLDRYPDPARQRAEWGMALLSLGAAVENLMVAAADAGLASCWVAAPIFCPEAARDALALPAEWLPHAMVVVGVPDPAYVGRPRPPVPLDDLRAHR